jgi:hypothetical protein
VSENDPDKDPHPGGGLECHPGKSMYNLAGTQFADTDDAAALVKFVVI